MCLAITALVGCRHDTEDVVPVDLCEAFVTTAFSNGVEMDFPNEHGAAYYEADLDGDGVHDVKFSLIHSSATVSHQPVDEFWIYAEGLNGTRFLKKWSGEQGFGPCTAGCSPGEIITNAPDAVGSTYSFETDVPLRMDQFVEPSTWLVCTAFRGGVAYVGFEIGPPGERQLGWFRLNEGEFYTLDRSDLAPLGCDHMMVDI